MYAIVFLCKDGSMEATLPLFGSREDAVMFAIYDGRLFGIEEAR